jgi:hypothetical protein
VVLSFFSCVYLLNSLLRLFIILKSWGLDKPFKVTDTLVDTAFCIYIAILLYRLYHFKTHRAYIVYLAVFLGTLNTFFLVNGVILRISMVYQPELESLYVMTRIIFVLVVSMTNFLVNYVVAHLVSRSTILLSQKVEETKHYASTLYTILFTAFAINLIGILIQVYLDSLPQNHDWKPVDMALLVSSFLFFPLHLTVELMYQFYLSLVVSRGYT